METARKGGQVGNLDANAELPPPSETPLAYRAVRGGLWVALGSWWTIGFGFATNIVLTRLLSPEIFGTFTLAMFFAQLLRLEPKMGVSQAFGQYKETSEEAVGTYLGLNSLIILVGLLLTGLAAPVLRTLGYEALVVRAALVLALAAALESTGGLAGVMLDKEMRFGPTSRLQMVVFSLSYIPAFWFATHGGGVWSLVSQTLVYSALLGVGGWWIARRQLPHIFRMRWRFRRSLAGQFLRFGIAVGATVLAAMLLTQLDNFLIGTIVGVAVLGFYDRAYRIAQWPSTLLTNMVSRAAFYTYARLQDDLPRLRKTVTMVLWMIVLLAWPIALVIFVTASDLVVLLYGERWLPSVIYLRLLVLIAAARPVWDNVTTLFMAIGKPRLNLAFMAVQIGVLIAAGWPLTLRWGAVGTCIAVALAFAVGLVGSYAVLRRGVGVQIDVGLLIPVLVSSLVVIGYMLINRLTDINALSVPVRVGVKTVWVLVTYFGLNWVLQPMGMKGRVKYIWRLVMQKQHSEFSEE